MKGIKFGDYHSYNDFSLILTEKKIGTPSPKTETIDIPGGDGVLDLTDFFGAVRYNNRELEFTFKTPVETPRSFLKLYSIVMDLLHGKKMRVILDDENDVFYYGRVTVNEWKSNRRIGEIVIEVDAEPFKQEIGVSSFMQNVKSNATLSIINAKMPVVPTIRSNAEFLISFNGFNEIYPAGTFTIPELEFGEGTNQVYVEGTGSITFEYRRGWL